MIGAAAVCVACGSRGKPVTVSPPCDSALKAVADNAEDADTIVAPLMDETLTACMSKAEWIAAAERYHVDRYGDVISG
jgi:hypothetical protein